MARIQVLIKIYGDNFDSIDFESRLPLELKGEVITNRNWRIGLAENRQQLWRSQAKSITDDDDLGEIVVEMVDDYKKYLREIRTTMNVTISLDVVTHFENADDVRGFWFPATVIRKLGEFNMSLDMDSYCYDESDARGSE